ncbi:MAG: serine hydrolase domain-containing protein [Pseudomonadota bacterium]
MKLRYVLMGAAWLIHFAAAAFAQSDSIPAPEAVEMRPRLDAPGLEQVFDLYFGPDNGLSFTGAAVAVVQDGEIVFTKGYGFANAARTMPVDPETTAFPVGSIAKTLVGVATAQLLDEGVIASIDDPVNAYLDRGQIPDNSGTPITLRMLATHQAGFADRRQPLMRPGEPAPETNGRYIEGATPDFIRPVNSGANYSNFGIALLGYALEDASGTAMDAYLEDNIFGPSAMAHARIVRDADDRGESAQGEIFYPNGGRRAVPVGWANNHTNKMSGGLVMSAVDAARYMIALTGGSSDGAIPALLSPQAQDAAFDRLGETHPLLQAYGLAFMVNDWNGLKLAEHGGRTLAGVSYLTLIPDEDIGIFAAVTGDSGAVLPFPALLGQPAPPPPLDDAVLPIKRPTLSTLRAAPLEHLLGRFVPPVPLEMVDLELTEYVGEYTSQRRPTGSVMKIFNTLFLGGGAIIATDNGDGTLTFGAYGRYQPVAPDIFYKSDARAGRGASGWSDLLVFRRDASGQVADAATTYTDMVMKRHAGMLRPSQQVTFLQMGSAGFLVTGLLALVWPGQTRGRWITAAMPGLLIALPIVLFRSWPPAPIEALSFLWITSSDLIVLQMLGNAIGLAVLAIFAIGIATLVRPDLALAGQGWRRDFAKWHLRLLIPAGVCLLIGLAAFDLIGWHLS